MISNRRKIIAFLIVVMTIFLAVVFFWLMYRQADPMEILRVGVAVSVGFAVVNVFGWVKTNKTIVGLLVLLVLAVIFVIIRIRSLSLVMQFLLLLAAALWIPYGLVKLVFWLPIKELYKIASMASLVPILALLLFGRWGVGVQTTATVFIAIPLFYIVIENCTVGEKRVCYGVFVFVFVVFSVVFGSLEYYMFPLLAFALFLLVVLGLSSSQLHSKSKRLLTILLMALSTLASYFGSLNSFHYLVGMKEQDSLERPCPVSLALIKKEGDTLADASLIGKEVALFFWSSHCANCHKEIPSFSKLAGEFESDTTKVFIAAFVPFGEDGDVAYYQKEIEQDFAFQWAEVVDGEKIMNELGFNSFPHLTIFDKSGQVVYNGSFVNQKGVFVNNPRKYLNY